MFAPAVPGGGSKPGGRVMRSILLLAGVLFLFHTPADAQTLEEKIELLAASRTLEPGTELRIQTAGTSELYVLRNLRADTLFLLRGQENEVLPLPWDHIESMQARVQRSSSSGALRGALIGGAIAGAGAIVYSLSDPVDTPDCGPPPFSWFCESPQALKVMGTIFVLGMPAMAVGALVGAAAPGSHWEDVDLQGDLRLLVGAQGRVGVQCSLPVNLPWGEFP